MAGLVPPVQVIPQVLFKEKFCPMLIIVERQLELRSGEVAGTNVSSSAIAMARVRFIFNLILVNQNVQPRRVSY
jgi:hypothetical protein